MPSTAKSRSATLLIAAALAAAACSRAGSGSSAAAQPTTSPGTPGTAGAPSGERAAQPAGGGGTAPGGTTAGAGSPGGGGTLGAAAPAPTPAGPRAQMPGEHYALTAVITPPSAVPGDTQLAVEVRGADGYHVNELYPVALEIQPTQATTPRATLRRADVAELTQQVASFRVPMRVTGAGATVTGTMRFAVCSAQNCIPHEQQFAVNLP